MSLESKAAIVTGGDSGIGHAISLELGRQGAAVTVNYHKNQEAADATVKAIEAAGGKAQAVQGDVSSVADLQASSIRQSRRSAASTSWSTTPAWRRGRRRSTRPSTSSTW